MQYDGFGKPTITTPNNGTAVVRLRLPGQIDYGVGGINYNYYRDYDPNVGRYLESDPIGLEGDINTYGYVKSNPLGLVDPLGLIVKRCSRILGGPEKPAVQLNAYLNSPIRHDYLSVSGQVLSFGPSGSFILSPGVISHDERPDNGKCTTICDDQKFDSYVVEAAQQIGEPKYCILAQSHSLYALLGARNCQSWSDDVLKLAKEKYLQGQNCPKCFAK
jgi:RHS repeat-associated protein